MKEVLTNYPTYNYQNEYRILPEEEEEGKKTKYKETKTSKASKKKGRGEEEINFEFWSHK